MSSTPDEARLTAIAERLNEAYLDSTGGGAHAVNFYQGDFCDDLRFLLAHVETLTQQVADWAAANEVIRQDFEDAKEENARLTADKATLIDTLRTWARLVRQYNEEVDAAEPYLKPDESMAECIARNRADMELVAELLVKEKARLLDSANHWMECCLKAEQQRAAALAALKRHGQHDVPCAQVEWTYEDLHTRGPKPACTCGFNAALAASAPQKDSATWRCIFCGEPSETGGGYEAGEVGPFCESCYLHIEEHFGQAPAPAQETERGR